VKALIAAGQDVNAREGQHGMRLVHLAVLGGRDEALKVLLAAGANRLLCLAYAQCSGGRAAVGGAILALTPLPTQPRIRHTSPVVE
jgi:hypothetical protein